MGVPIPSGVLVVFMVGVAGGFELEGGVLDVAVSDQAALQLVEQAGTWPSWKQSSTTTCAVRTGRPVATVEARRS